MGSILIGFVALFNIRRMLPDWKVTILVYFFPAIFAFLPFISMGGNLYPWEPVLAPLPQ